MSQAGDISAIAGPVPPTVPTSFVTDSGTAVPALNILNVLTSDTIANDDDGITDTGSGNTVTTFITNRITATATTSDGAGQTQTVTLLTPSNSTAQTFNANVTGFDSAGNAMTGGTIIGISRKAAGIVTVVGTNDVFEESDATLATADYNIISSGGDIIAEFIGVAGLSINWKVLFTYIIVS